jgi:glycosyltransferase involved in cell wall biosynthesis
MKILIANPALVRLHSLGACEQDRLTNVDRLRALGHEVHVFTGYMPYQNEMEVRAFYAARHLEPTLVRIGGARFDLRRFTRLATLDGMAWEYAAPHIQSAATQLIERFHPDVMWCHGSYTWGPGEAAQRAGVPVIIRSVNYEPEQLLHEAANVAGKRIRYAAKKAGEARAMHLARVMAAITPDEAAIYRRIGGGASVETLPLQTLPALLRPAREAAADTPLQVFMMGASYNVQHNRAALAFVVEQVVPAVRTAAPGAFVFHVLGSKVPAEFTQHAAPDLVFDGYVPDLDAHLDRMDIALAPSLGGVGMQQKVFEPLCRAFPTLTHQRAMAGYPFVDGEHVLLAEDAAQYVQALLSLRDASLRARLSSAAAQQAAALFGEAQIRERIGEMLAKAQG